MEKRDLTTGALIPAFGAGGVVTSNPSGSFDGPYDIAVDATGIYVVGDDQIPGNSQWRIEKRDLTNGNLLWVQTSNPSAQDDTARGVAVDSSGIYVVGVREVWVWDNDWYMEKRDLTNGNLLWTKTSNPSGDNIDEANGVTVDSSGIYVVGFISLLGEGNIGWRIEKRDLTGNVLWEKISSSSGADSAGGVTVGSNGIYVVGSDNAPGNAQWRIEKRESGGGGGPGGVDCGLRAFDGTSTSTVTIDCENPAVSPLRVQKGATTYGLNLVDPADANASRIRLQTPAGLKALRRQ